MDQRIDAALVSAAPTRLIMTALLAWLVAAIAIGASGFFSSGRLPPQAAPAVLWVLVFGQAVVLWRVRPVRAWAMTVDLRLLMAFHLTRFVGGYFLYLYSVGRLPFAFAVPGGSGDLAIAVSALLLILVADCRVRPPRPRAVLLVWNLAGLADIMMVVVTAARLWFTAPDSMAELTRLPLVLLPTFVVPIIIVSHGVMIARLIRR